MLLLVNGGTCVLIYTKNNDFKQYTSGCVLLLLDKVKHISG